MRRFAMALCMCTLGVLGARPARAGGLWAEGTLRTSWLGGTYQFVDQVNPGYGQTGALKLDAQIDTMAVELQAALGYSDSKYFAIGAGPSLSVFGANTRIAESTLAFGYLAGLSLEAGLRPLGDGLLFRPSVGLAQCSFVGSTNDIGSADNIFEFETLRGPVLGAGAGWADGLWGVMLRVSYARLEADRSKFHPVFIGIGVVLQHWQPDPGRAPSAAAPAS